MIDNQPTAYDVDKVTEQLQQMKARYFGNNYPLYLGSCNADSLNEDRQIEIKPNEKIEFTSSSSWCNSVKNIPAFSGVIPDKAKKIYFHINEFGEFTDITFSFDL